MRVTSYGLFWREAEIDWHPGQGNANSFRLLGRVGANRGTLKMADFRYQQGIYVLYDDYGPVYVGLTRNQGLGKRLKDHLSDHLENKWDRFSWFGFTPLSPKANAKGMIELHDSNHEVTEDTWATIGDLEALLIRLMNPKNNTVKMKFADAQEWKQVEYNSISTYAVRLPYR